MTRKPARRAKPSPVAHKCGGKCTCHCKPASARQSGAVSMIVPGVKLTGAALDYVVSEAAALGVPHAVVVESALRCLAEFIEARRCK